MYTQAFRTKVICPMCQDNRRVTEWGGMGSEVYLQCDSCNIEFTVEIIDGKFMSRIRPRL